MNIINSTIDVLTGMGGNQTRLCQKSRVRVVFNGGIVVASLAVALGKVQLPFISETASKIVGGIVATLGSYMTYKSFRRAKSHCTLAAKRTTKSWELTKK